MQNEDTLPSFLPWKVRPFKMVLVRRVERETCQYHFSLLDSSMWQTNIASWCGRRGRAWSIAGCVLVAHTHALSKQRLLVCSCTRLFYSRLLTKDSASSCAAQTETGLFICQLYPRGYGITSLGRNMIECRPVVDVWRCSTSSASLDIFGVTRAGRWGREVFFVLRSPVGCLRSIWSSLAQGRDGGWACERGWARGCQRHRQHRSSKASEDIHCLRQ